MRQDKKNIFEFIDLAKLGRTNWISSLWVVVLTSLASFVAGALCELIRILWPSWFDMQMLDQTFDFFMMAFTSAAKWIGFMVAATLILRRPFLTLLTSRGTFRLKRVMLGAALWLLFRLVIMGLFIGIAMVSYRTLPSGFMNLQWPTPAAATIALLTIVIIPLQAGGEELEFRGWLTQAIGLRVRNRLILALIVAVIFVSLHGRMSILDFVSLFIVSLGLSALSLSEGRLELAIGAHSMNNIFSVVWGLIYVSGRESPFNDVPRYVTWSIAILSEAVPYLLMLAALRFIELKIQPTHDQPHRCI
jgi:uncharacterized protein